MIDALHDTNTSLLTFKLNDIMRTLTVFSVIVLPLTLLAGIFGMNTVLGMPFTENRYGFWLIMGIMILSAAVMLAIFKKRKWL
jgi:magnesium transporter